MFRKRAQFVSRPEEFVEELFLQRYDQMLEWALHLTDHRAEQAEDLAHDAFVQLTLSPPDFNAITNLDGYLYVVLRNLHRSQMQRALCGPGGPASTVDYDSAEAGLKAADPRQQLQAVEELRLVCRYACARKESSKAGSALILRFFHGYYPGEIAALLCVSRAAIKELLRMARGEAKLFLDDPAKLGFIAELPTDKELEIKTGATIEETMAGLRQGIFATRQGRCLERKHLAEIYDAARPELLTVPLLAHLVSCPDCLEEANRLLKLPPLSDRDPNDMLGPDRGAKAGGGKPTATPLGANSKTRARQKALKKYRRRLREVYEHEPRELRIAVNGFVLAQQEITAAVHKQTLGIEVAEELTLIEVLSEQGVRLLALHVAAPPTGQFEQHTRVEFSEGRTLATHLNFCGSWPHLEITYECGSRVADCGASDCGLRIADCGLEKVVDSPGDSPQPLFTSFSESKGLFAKLLSAISNPRPAIKWLLRPVTITVLLAILLITVVVGQRMGWWFATPPKSPLRRETRPGKAFPERPAPDAPAAEPGPGRANPLTTSTFAPSVRASITPVTATAELEVEALRLLQQAGADLGEQVEAKRTAHGQLLIEGLLETDARKAELFRALQSLANHPAVIIRIETVAEVMARRRASGKSAANSATNDERRIEVEKIALPIAAELRAYLQARGGAASEDEIHNLAARLHNQALRALDRLYALQRLSRQISPAQCDALAPKAQAKFLGLLARHAYAYATQTQRLREELGAILKVPAPSPDAPDAIHNTAELYRAVAQLFAFGKSAHTALDQSLTISSRPAAATTIKSPPFWRTLINAETLAAQIAEYATQYQTTPGREQ
jgi:RNA polymerase sigma factor (sigma-70 family)